MMRPNCHAIVVILDADDDCPKDLAPELLNRARNAAQSIPVSVVLPKAELEAWFVGSIESLRGVRGISTSASSPENPETIRDAKGFLTEVMGGDRHYIETTDQTAFIAAFDIDQARRNCRSFRKFYEDFHRIVDTLSQEDL
jgi:hypothetical protein